MSQFRIAFFSIFLYSIIATGVEPLEPYLPALREYKRLDFVDVNQLKDEGSKIKRSLNGTWKCSGLTLAPQAFAADEDMDKKYQFSEFDDSRWDNIEVPLNWYKKYPDKQDEKNPYVKGWYRKTFELSLEEVDSHRIVLKFDVIGYDALVFLNGKEVGRHQGDFTPFELDVTHAAKPGRNVIAIRVLTDNLPKSALKTPLTRAYGSLWAMNNIRGGIWQNVTLSIEPEIRIARILVTPLIKNNEIEVDYNIINHFEKNLKVTIHSEIIPAVKPDFPQIVAHCDKNITLNPGDNSGSFKIKITAPVFWSVENPYLYYLKIQIKDGAKVLSSDSVRFGYREFKTENGKFFLNSRQIYLFGQNISSIVYGGNGRPEEEETKRLEAEIHRFKQTGTNIVRNAHMPVIPAMLELADEYGLMIYYEWAWSFIHNLNIKEFEKNNLKEVGEYVINAYNHPSVVMWCLGNEIPHRKGQANANDIVMLLDKQVSLVKKLDKSGRPVSTFSGSGGWYSYGENKLETDVLDMHNYTGLYDPWTKMFDVFRRQYQGALKIYGETERLSRPLIAWENVGFSWGAYVDSKFRRGNIKDYAQYVHKPTSWARPNGIGFTGTVPLFKALSPGFGQWAQTLYGRRIFELFRINANFSGFAPWFKPIPASLLWNQPVYPSIHSDNYLFPSNLFAGESKEWNLCIVNDADQSHEYLTMSFQLHDARNNIIDIGVFEIPELRSHSRIITKYTLSIPPEIPVGAYQLRLKIKDKHGKEISRNYYDLFLQHKSILKRPVKAERKVFVLDTGAKRNLNELAALLNDFGMSFTTVKDIGEIKENNSLMIVPPEMHEEQLLRFDTLPSVRRFMSETGGIILILEQKNPRSTFPGNLALMPHDSTFIDLVIPDHPIFKGLNYWNFDTWNTTHGYVVHHSFIPFTQNALAIKGPTFSRTNLGSAIIEAIIGKGRLILSQLAAVSARKLDSVAATYLYNLISYATGNQPVTDTLPLVENASGYLINEKSISFIDLAPYANRSFSDEKADDGKGGWLDQGENDFRMMPLGKKNAADIPFYIIDPELNNGKSCLVVRGSEKPLFPLAITGIMIEKKVSRLFFLHTAGWGGSGAAGVYRIHYSDGSSIDYPIQGRNNIGDWWDVAPLPEAKVGFTCKNFMNRNVGTFVAAWDNPKPEITVASMDFLSAGAADTGKIDWLPVGTPVPVLIAVSAEIAHNNTVELLGKHFKTFSNSKELNSSVTGKAELIKDNDKNILRVNFPECSGKDVPAVRIVFDTDNLEKEYHFLSFWVKSKTNGIIQFVLAGKDWKGTFSGEVNLKSDEQWHKYRLMFNTNFTKWKDIDFNTLKGELFIFYRSKNAPGISRPELSFDIKDILLE